LNTEGGRPATLAIAIDYFTEMVTEQGVDLTDCGSVFGIKSTSRKRSGREEEQEDDYATKAEKMIAAVTSEKEALAVEIAGMRKEFKRLKSNKNNERFGKVMDECRNYAKDKTCTFEKDKGRPCRFTHSGSNAKINGVIKPVKVNADVNKKA